MIVRPLALTILCILSTLPAFAQSQSLMSGHNHSGAGADQMIDGSTNPELITDTTAYRLFLVAISPTPTPSAEGKGFRSATFRNFSFTAAESDALDKVLATFRAKYDELVKEYNDAADAAIVRGDAPDHSDLLLFTNRREALVNKTRERLRQVLSPEHMSSMDTVVRREKVHMRVAVPQSQIAETQNGGQNAHQ